jgi:S-adenosylmethionine decarboxylase
MQGLHITADCYACACDSALLTDAALLGAHCKQAVNEAGLQAVAQLFHTFPATPHGPGGVTATILLAESHLCVHTWPEQRAATLDVYVCNFGGDHSTKAEALMGALEAVFLPGRVVVQRMKRGEIGNCGVNQLLAPKT